MAEGRGNIQPQTVSLVSDEEQNHLLTKELRGKMTTHFAPAFPRPFISSAASMVMCNGLMGTVISLSGWTYYGAQPAVESSVNELPA